MSAQRGFGNRIGTFVLLLAGGLLGAGAHAQNAAPTISGSPPLTAKPGQAYEFQPTASDPDGNRLMFNASGVPNWARFDKKTGRVSGSPSARDLGKGYPILISVSDGKLSATLPKFTVTVEAGSPPTIGGTPATSVTEGELYVFEPTASDPDGDTLKFGVSGKPAWASFSTTTGLLSGIPPVGSAGTYSNISIGVSDGASSVALAPFSISVQPKGNSAPEIWGVPALSVGSGQAYSFQPSASDPDGQPLTFRVAGLPQWASFDTAIGKLAGTPSPSDGGKYSGITISVSDGLATSSLAPFSIDVIVPNSPPTISGVPADSVKAGQSFAFAPTASDPDGQKLSFSIANKPAWASFDATSGLLTGTPASTDASSYSNIVISVSDGQYSASLPAFSVTVLADTQGSATVHWKKPTTTVDGLPLTNLAGYRVVYGQSADNLSLSLVIANPDITSAVIEQLAPGTWYFAAKAFTTANVESDLSPIGQKTIY